MPLLLLVLITLTSGHLHAADSVPLISGHNYNLVQEVEYLLDDSHKLTIEDIKGNPSWQSFESKNINFSFIDEALWLRFSVIAQETGEWVIEIPFPMLEDIQFHSLINNQAQEMIQTGMGHPFSQRPEDRAHFSFPFELQSGDQLDVYMRVTTSGSTEVPIHVKTRFDSDLDYELSNFMLGWMNGILVVMIFYNMIIYIITKDHLYMTYSMFVLSFILIFAGYNGTGFQYLWPNSPDINKPIFAFVNGFYQVASCLFAAMFLKVFQNNDWTKPVFKYLLTTLLVLLPLSPFLPYQFIILTYLLLTTILYISAVSAGVFYSIRGDRSALYFTIAWFIFFISATVANFRVLGYLPINWFTINAYQIGVIIEITILSIALAQRIETDRLASILNLKRYQDLYNNTLSGQFILDKRGVLQTVNPAYCKMLGYDTEEEIIELSRKGNGRYFYLDKKIPDRIGSTLKKSKKAFDIEIQLNTKNDIPKWFSVSIQAIKNDKGEIESFEGSIIDIQERKENENLNKKTIQERMIAMEHLVVGICHEINTPLGVTTTAISHLKDDIKHLNQYFNDGKLTKEIFSKRLEYEGEATALIEDNLERINKLVKNFKEVSVLEKRYAYRTEGLCNIINEQRKKFSSLIDPERLHITCQQPLDFIGYPEAIEDIISQIMSNCINHGISENEGEIFIDAIQHNENIKLTIADNGKGIDIENIRDIFNPFYTTKRGAGGSIGLGLYQVFNIITQLLDGTVDVKNTHPGTVFTIQFPLHVREKVEIDNNNTEPEMSFGAT